MSFLKSHLLYILPFVCWSFADMKSSESPFHSFDSMDDKKLVQLFPNPASTVINFTYQGPASQQHILQIYNFIGKKMTEVRIYGNTRLTLQLNDSYYRGIYIYQLHDLDGRLIESGKFQVVK